MGFLSEIKRLLWAQKAVADSAAEKAADKTKEVAGDFVESAGQAWHKGVEKAGELKDKVVEKTADLFEKDQPATPPPPAAAGDWAPREAPVEPSGVEKAGEKIGHAAAKAGEAVERTVDKIKTEGKELIDDAVKTSDKIWEKAEETGSELWEKAKTAAGKAGEKIEEGIDHMLHKARKLDEEIEAERDKIDPNRDGWADQTLQDKMKEHASTLKDKDDFFAKAERFADGDYSMGKPVVTKPEADAGEASGPVPLPPLPKKDDFADDAILDEEK
jgi:polyhydroxyalkanoate synthesis regulator phasin